MIIFSQRDEKWKNYKYSAKAPHTETIMSSGCGITTAAMIVSNLTGEYVEPPKMADYSVKNGHRIDGVGTAFSLFPAIGKLYNLNCVQTNDIFKAVECVRGNGLVACSTNGGVNKLFSTGGHIFLMSGISGNDCEFIDPDNYNGKYETDYRKKRAKIKNGKIYVNVNEAKKHITTYFMFERKNNMEKNIYSFDNTVEHMIRLGITDKANMEHWEKCLNGMKDFNKDEVRTIFDRFIKKIYN